MSTRKAWPVAARMPGRAQTRLRWRRRRARHCRRISTGPSPDAAGRIALRDRTWPARHWNCCRNCRCWRPMPGIRGRGVLDCGDRPRLIAKEISRTICVRRRRSRYRGGPPTQSQRAPCWTRAPFPAVNVPNDLAAHWMPFTANRAFKKNPRMLASAKDMHYFTVDGRRSSTPPRACGLNAGHGRSQFRGDRQAGRRSGLRAAVPVRHPGLRGSPAASRIWRQASTTIS